MNDKELISAVLTAMYQQRPKQRYAVPADALMDIRVLPKKKYKDCRDSRVPYLEAALHHQPPQAFLHYALNVNLRKGNR